MLNENKAELIVTAVPPSNYYDYSLYRLLSPAHLEEHAGFLVEDYFFSSRANHIGMSEEYFHSCTPLLLLRSAASNHNSSVPVRADDRGQHTR